MKTSTKPVPKVEVLTSDDVRRMIKEAVACGEKKLDLSGRTIQSVDLRDCDVPMSLDFSKTVILGDVFIGRGKFTGSFIDFDDAKVKGCFTLTDLGQHEFSLYLRHAHIMGVKRYERSVRLCGISLHWLCIGGLRIKNGSKQVGMAGVTITNAISFEPSH